MSTVLWTNSLLDGRVETEESDKYALYRHTDKLDKICKTLNIPPFSTFCDSTDLRFNLDDKLELPEGMQSTNELMARDGVWLEAQEAVLWMEKLLAEIRSKKIKFGFLKDDHNNVVSELEESLVFARAAAAKQGKFNFSIVM